MGHRKLIRNGLLISLNNPKIMLGDQFTHHGISSHHIFVAHDQAATRIDKFLVEKFPTATRTKIQLAITHQFILVNKKPTKANYKVAPCDEIQVQLLTPPPLDHIIPENIPLDIIYEDDALLIINKPAGMVVHPAAGHWQGTLVNALVYHFKNLPHKYGHPSRPGLVHRIDKGTSGLLVVAKTEEALVLLAKQFYDHTITRTYTCLVWGQPKHQSGTIDINIGRSKKERQSMATYQDSSCGKCAITHYQVMKHMGHVSLINCHLETGRTHQIRVHMKHLGHTIFGDRQYGGDQILSGQHFASYKAFVRNCLQQMPHQALHAHSLGFIHPITQQKMSFDTALPVNFKKMIENWEKYAHHH